MIMQIARSQACLVLAAALFISCNSESHSHSHGDPEKIKSEIAGAEKDFENMAAEKSIMEAFWFYADSNAVIKRENDSLIMGKDNIRNYYSADFYKTATVKWSPDFISVSENGDMAWTYGKYVWESKDSTGKPVTHKGVFHTVWQRQPDGKWKYVWD